MNGEADGDVSDLAIDGVPTGAPPTSPDTSDREFEFSLRLLTGVVLAALLASVGLLSYKWVHPLLDGGDATPVVNATRRPVTPASSTATAPARGDEVLMAPGKVFRCEEQGVASFSDQSTCGNPRSAQPGKKP